MARNGFYSGRGSKCCSYKRITVVVCCLNLVAALLLLRSFYSSFFLGSSSSSSNLFSAGGHSEDQIKRVEESIRVRKELEPTKLATIANNIKKEFATEEKKRMKLLEPMKQKLISEVLQRLKELEDNATLAEQRDAVESWRAKKLGEVKIVRDANSTISVHEAKTLERALNSSWLTLMQDIGLWFAADVPNMEISDKPENEQELDEEEIVAGRPLPPECHAELHTDYDGTAVKWGLTHHKESAADCCQACLDQAKHAKPGELKCNIWVYCPSEFGCYSPDIYEHKHQECWLKQADEPRLNFKDKYSESYRSAHPTAPVVVPWISGVVGA